MERVPYGTPLQNSIITRREKFLETLILTLTLIHDIINMPIIKYSNFIDFWVGCHKKLLLQNLNKESRFYWVGDVDLLYENWFDMWEKLLYQNWFNMWEKLLYEN